MSNAGHCAGSEQTGSGTLPMPRPGRGSDQTCMQVSYTATACVPPPVSTVWVGRHTQELVQLKVATLSLISSASTSCSLLARKLASSCKQLCQLA